MHRTLSSPDVPMCPIQRMSPIFPGLLVSSLIYFLFQDSVVLSATVQGTGGPMPVPASATRDRKKGQFDM